jgi:hypothetical protein
VGFALCRPHVDRRRRGSARRLSSVARRYDGRADYLGIAELLRMFMLCVRRGENRLGQIPGVVFFLIAVFILLANEFQGAIPFAISSLFILTGLYMIYRTVRADFGSKPDQPNSSAELPQVS